MSVLGRLRAKFVRSTGRFSDDSGATAIEFAMVGPLFFLMIGCILETGLMLFTEYVLQTSAQEAARLVRTGQAQNAQLTLSQFKSKLCNLAGIIIDCNGKVTVYMTSTASSFQTLNGAGLLISMSALRTMVRQIRAPIAVAGQAHLLL